MAKPLIGITTYVEPASWGHWGQVEAALIPYSYVRAVERAGGRAVLVPPDEAGIDEVLDALDGLVFSGGWDRFFRAFDDLTGEVRWQMRLNNAINSFPISYSVNGKQYVAVAVGNGSSHSKALATLTPEIQNPDGGSVLWVFALSDR